MFCASQASTDICMNNMDQPSSSSSSSSTYNPGSTPFIDRHNPIIGRDARRIIPPKPPCSFKTPISPKPQKPQIKNQNSSTKQNDYLVLSMKSKKQSDEKKKQSFVKENDNSNITVKKNAVVKASSLITPPGSTRYLLGDSGFFNMYSDFDPVVEPKTNQFVKIVEPVEPKKNQIVKTVEPKQNQILKTDESSSSSDSNSSKPSASSLSSDQVVVLRVSLHCKGCEAKVKKHISRMPGVTTFDIDFAAKKVTVIGDVTPLSVLASISKVKNAQLLDPSSVPPSYFAGNK